MHFNSTLKQALFGRSGSCFTIRVFMDNKEMLCVQQEKQHFQNLSFDNLALYLCACLVASHIAERKESTDSLVQKLSTLSFHQSVT